MSGGANSAMRGAEFHSRILMLIESGRAAEAESEITSAPTDISGDPELVHFLGVALMRQGRMHEAVKPLRRAASMLPDRMDVALNLGHSLLDGDCPSEAVAPLAIAAESSPSLWQAHYLLGIAHQRNGNAGEAAASFEKALLANPHLWDARLHLMSLLPILERYDDAIAVARGALVERPDDNAVRHDLAMLLALSGDPGNAIMEIELVLARQPAMAMAWNTFGNLLGGLKRRAEGMSCYRLALILDPSLADAHYNLANLSRESEDYIGAIIRYRRALGITPMFVNARNNLADAQLASGEVRAALSDMRSASSLRRCAPICSSIERWLCCCSAIWKLALRATNRAGG